MNTLIPTPSLRHTLPALTLLLTLAFSAITPVTAQPALSDDEMDQIAKLERSITAPDFSTALTRAQWDTYGDNLERTLATDHAGLQQGALRMIIVYGENLGIDREAVLDIVRIYRDNPDDRLRRMAVVALGATQDAWAMDFLKRSVRFESSPVVRHTIQAVVSGYASAGPAKVGS